MAAIFRIGLYKLDIIKNYTKQEMQMVSVKRQPIRLMLYFKFQITELLSLYLCASSVFKEVNWRKSVAWQLKFLASQM